MTIGPCQDTALLVSDIDIASAGTAMPITDRVGAVVGFVLGIGVVDGHGQGISFQAVGVAPGKIEQVDHMDAVHPVMAGGKATAIGNGLVNAILILPLHQDVAGRPVVIELE
ncbi:hypothetical protein D3C76_767090 [compost metagenome]